MPEKSNVGIWQRTNLLTLSALIQLIYLRHFQIESTSLIAIALAVLPARWLFRSLTLFSLATLLIVPHYLVMFHGPPIATNTFDAMSLAMPLGASKLGLSVLASLALNAAVLLAGFALIREACVRIPPSKAFFAFGPVLILLWVAWSKACYWLGPLPATAIAMLLAFVSRALISVSLYVRKPGAGRLSFADLLWLLPFWILYLPCWAPQPIKEQKTTEQEQKKIFLHMLLTAALVFVAEILQRRIYFNHGDAFTLYFHRLGFDRLATVERFPLAKAWVSVTVSTAHFIATVLWAKTAVPYFFLGILGTKLPSPMRNPLVANSFHDFFARLFVYYSRALLNLVCFPIYRFLGSFGVSGGLKKNLSIGIGVFVFAEIFHLLRDYWVFMPTRDILLSAVHFREFSFYSALMAAAVMISIWLEGSRVKPLWLRISLSPVYFYLYGVILIFGNFSRETLVAKWLAVKFLFTWF